MDQQTADIVSESEIQHVEILVVDANPSDINNTNIRTNCHTTLEQNDSDPAYASNKSTEIQTNVIDESQEPYDYSLVNTALTQNEMLENTEQGMLSSYSDDGNFVISNTAIPLKDSCTENELKAAVSNIADACNITNKMDELNTVTNEGKNPDNLWGIEQVKTEDILQLFPFVCGICALQFNRIDTFYTHFESHSELTDEYFHQCTTDTSCYGDNSSIVESEDHINTNNHLYHCMLCRKTFLTICQLHDHIINEEKVSKYVYDDDSRSVDKVHLRIKECIGRNPGVALLEKDKSLQMTAMFETSKENNIETNENVPKTNEHTQHRRKSSNSKLTGSDNVISISLNKYDLIKDMKFEGIDKNTGVRYKLNVAGQTATGNNNVDVSVKECIEENSPDTFDNYTESDDIIYFNGEQIIAEKRDIKILTEKQSFKPSEKRQKLELKADNVTLSLNGEAVSQPASSEVMLPCDICGKFYRKSYLKHHKTMHRPTRDYKCDVCTKAFKTKYTLEYHKKIHRTDKNYVCEECGQTFKTRDYLRIHTKSKHGLNLTKRKAVKDGPSICPICGETFKTKTLLKMHTRTHHAVKEFPCEICGRIFTKRYNLKSHQSTHTDVRDLPCHICGKTFKTRGSLTQHILTHTAVKDIPCPMCPEMFNNKAILKAHMVRHSDDKPFICETCGDGFKRVDQLTNHRYTHTEVRNYACSTCGKTFKMNSNLVQHEKIHGRYPKHCEYCGKGFVNNYRLKLHLKTHFKSD